MALFLSDFLQSIQDHVGPAGGQTHCGHQSDDCHGCAVTDIKLMTMADMGGGPVQALALKATARGVEAKIRPGHKQISCI